MKKERIGERMERIAETQNCRSGAVPVFQKNQEFTGFVEGVGSNGEGIVRFGETVYFAPFTVLGEKVKFKALKVKNRIGYAKAIEILTKDYNRRIQEDKNVDAGE